MKKISLFSAIIEISFYSEEIRKFHIKNFV